MCFETDVDPCFTVNANFVFDNLVSGTVNDLTECKRRCLVDPGCLAVSWSASGQCHTGTPGSDERPGTGIGTVYVKQACGESRGQFFPD